MLLNREVLPECSDGCAEQVAHCVHGQIPPPGLLA